MSRGWSYGHDLPPERWSEAFPDALGSRQSPIELWRDVATADQGLGPLQSCYKNDEVIKQSLEGFFFEDLHFEAKIKKDCDAGGVTIGGVSHRLLKFHLHTPGEHAIDGVTAPLEIHLVHESPVARSQGTVIAVPVQKGKVDSPVILLFLALLPTVTVPDRGKREKSARFAPPESLNACFSEASSYYRYQGSLTTPPCTGGYDFYVLDQPIEATEATIARFARYVPGGNNRPLQPINGRPIGYHDAETGGGTA